MAPKKRISQVSAAAVNIFDLNDTFWESENCLQQAENSIREKLCTRDGITELPGLLEFLGAYVIKVFSLSLARSGNPQANSILSDVFLIIEKVNEATEEIEWSMHQYLTTCITCSDNFSNVLRSSLTRTLVSRTLYPTIALLTACKSGQNLMIDWLKKLLEDSKSAVSSAVVGKFVLCCDFRILYSLILLIEKKQEM